MARFLQLETRSDWERRAIKSPFFLVVFTVVIVEMHLKHQNLIRVRFYIV